jgi:methylated-DNA-protein-cysteine methyltransferase-like protein
MGEPKLYERIYAAVRSIPTGRVATYGQIAKLVGGCSAQMVGFALAGLPENSGVPWQRVVNVKGMISPHGFGYGSAMQRSILEEEGIQFDLEGKIDFKRYNWLQVEGGQLG